MDWSQSGRLLIAGLGNPGPRYALTRHNWGFLLADALANEGSISLTREKHHAHMNAGEVFERSVVILKPQTYMNRSGLSIASALDFYRVEINQCVVIHDDLDLPFGVVKVKVGGGHGGHNGLRSIVAETGSRDFIRVRMGIGRPPLGSVADWVLTRFSEAEFTEINDVLRTGLLALKTLFAQGPTAAMNAVNGLIPPQREES